MARGYFLRVGDKTTCGGEILTGDVHFTWDGVPAARQGDVVTCGKHPGTYQILGGVISMFDEGRMLAGTLDSVSACPCRAQLINSITDSYLKEEAPGPFTWATAANNTPPPSAVKALPAPPVPVFAKSRERGADCTDAGTAEEPHKNFGSSAYYQAVENDPSTNSTAEQRAQTAKRKPTSETTEKLRYKRLFGSSEKAATIVAAPIATGGSKALVDIGAQSLKFIGGSMEGAGFWLTLPETVGLMGLLYSTKLNSGEQDFIDNMRLNQLAEQRGKAETRVRFQWVDAGNGRMKPVGYHTPLESGLGQVPVRTMTRNSTTGAYEFWADGASGPTILWTPDDPGFKAPANTGNQNDDPYLPTIITITPIPDEGGPSTTETPMPEEGTFWDYILVHPTGAFEPVYIYLSKPPVKLLDVDLYSNLNGRPRQGMHADHMPSAAAVRAKLKRMYPDAKPSEIDSMAKDVAAIVIPADIHQKLSATYGGRNKPEQIEQDSRDLRSALERDIETIRPALKERGVTEEQIDEAKLKMHKLNQEQGLYE